MNTQPKLLLYCQHSLGMGHWVRSMTLASALTRTFNVTFLNGGLPPEHQIPVPEIQLINLPPLGMGENHQLYSQDDNYSVKQAMETRRKIILQTYRTIKPDVILIELFPFGRKKLAGELLPLIKTANRDKQSQPLVLCSLRDIMVNARKDQLRHDERARWITDRYFDGLLVHSDPNFVNLNDSFRPRNQLETPVHYTGFVVPETVGKTPSESRDGVLVSVGGGMVGGPLLQAAVEAHLINYPKTGLRMTMVAGPFLPEQEWQQLSALCEDIEGLTLIRSVPSMKPMLASHSISVSQCGYNTVMDIFDSGIKALVVPFIRGQEDEQLQRADKLHQLGLVKLLMPDQLNGAMLAEQIIETKEFRPNQNGLNLAGADETVVIIEDLLEKKKCWFQLDDSIKEFSYAG